MLQNAFDGFPYPMYYLVLPTSVYLDIGISVSHILRQPQRLFIRANNFREIILHGTLF